MDDGRPPSCAPFYRLFVRPPEPAGMAHGLAGAQERRQRPRLLLRHDVWRGDHRFRRPRHSGVGRFHGAFVAFFFALFWIASPAVASWISRSAETEDRLRIFGRRHPHAALRRAAHMALFRILRHFRAPQSAARQLPGKPGAGRRASHVADQYRRLSAVGGLARDFGWISLSDAITRIDATMSTIEGMPRERGHTLQLVRHDDAETPVPALYFRRRQRQPRRTSGGGGGGTARNGAKPLRFISRRFPKALSDTVTILGESLEELPDDRRQLRPLRQRLADRLDGLRRAVDAIKAQPENGLDPDHQPGRAGWRDPQAGRGHSARRPPPPRVMSSSTGRQGSKPPVKRCA